MRKPILIIILIILALVLLSQTFYTVDEKSQAIVLQMGEYKRTVTKAGLHAKIPFIQSVKTLDKRVLTSAVEEEKYLTLGEEGIGVDIRLSVDHVTRWRISDPQQFYVSFRGEGTAETRLQGIVVDELKSELASNYWVDIVSSKREEITRNVTERVAQQMASRGVEVIEVRLKRTDLPTDVEEGVFNRVIAERQAEAKRARAEGEQAALEIRAEADRERTVILAEAYKQSETVRGEGDALAAAIYAAAYAQAPEFYSLLRTLQAYHQVIDEESTLVLSTESDIFKHLAGVEPSSEQPSSEP